MTSALVELKGISKAYPGVVALEALDFRLVAGEVRALLGKNGAGKSTLVKILAGVVKSDSGTIKISGELKSLQSPADGIKAGIATVHQELSVVPDMSVAENIYIGSWPRRNGRIDWDEMHRGAAKVLLRLGVTIDPKLSIRKISIAERQLVEIGRALRQGARILILDEPTSSLVAHEVEVLLAVIRSLAASGVHRRATRVGGARVSRTSHRMDRQHCGGMGAHGRARRRRHLYGSHRRVRASPREKRLESW